MFIRVSVCVCARARERWLNVLLAAIKSVGKFSSGCLKPNEKSFSDRLILCGTRSVCHLHVARKTENDLAMINWVCGFSVGKRVFGLNPMSSTFV